MLELTHPHHRHPRAVWLVPDSALGRAAGLVFCAGTTIALGVPVLALSVQQLLEPGQDTLWFFLAWGLTMTAIATAVVAGIAAALALVRDHALLLLLPVVIGAVLAFVAAG